MQKLMVLGLVLGLSAVAVAQVSSNGPVVADYDKNIQSSDAAEAKIAKEVRHELLMIPYYSLFDDLQYTVQGRDVALGGAVTSEHAFLKNQAGNVVQHIEGVDKVTNDIRILPPSPLDDQVREQVYHAIAQTGGLSKYFWEAAPSIHIIVENQRVTLSGFVLNEGDKNMAGIAANGVPGIFGVTNNLRVVK